jgi:hypothetical protein
VHYDLHDILNKHDRTDRLFPQAGHLTRRSAKLACVSVRDGGRVRGVLLLMTSPPDVVQDSAV